MIARSPTDSVPVGPGSPLPDADAYRRKRAGSDLYGRSLVGPLFYAVGCVVTAAVGGYFHPLRLIAWLAPALFLALFGLRRANHLPDDFRQVAPYAAWRRRHWSLIHAGCVLWSAVFVYIAAVGHGYGPPVVIAAICSTMFGTASSQAFAMEKRQTTLTLALLFIPALVLFAVTPSLRALGVTVAVYSLYLLSSLRRLAREYDVQIEIEYALLLSRAEVEKLTRIDALTGLANRREYEHVYPQAWHHAVRQMLPLAVLVFDLDHFKDLNDRHGHLAGDACLRHFAAVLRSHFRREADFLARIGGEEFVAVLPGTEAMDATRLAERLRESLELSAVRWHDDDLRFTVSIGVGYVDGAADQKPEATFARVDAACYEAKKAGRNGVALARGEQSLSLVVPPLSPLPPPASPRGE